VEAWRNEIKMKVTAARGILDGECLGGQDAELDEAIIKLASRCLNGSHLTTFYFGYRCQPDWPTVKDLFQTRLHKELELETVRRFARDVVKSLRMKAPQARELDEWERNYKARKRNENE
jgi:hypothetical protein